MSDFQTPPMSDEFKSRMRKGLSTLVAQEKVRDERRKRAIAGGVIATAIVAVVGIVGGQIFGPTIADELRARQGRAQPPVVTEVANLEPTKKPAEPTAPARSPTPTAPAQEYVASGPIVLEYNDVPCEEATTNCRSGDAAAGGPATERLLDAYFVCGPSGQGQVYYGGKLWADCVQTGADVGAAQFGIADHIEDGDPTLTVSDDFDGWTALVPEGSAPPGQLPVATVTVFVDCDYFVSTVTVGDVAFPCNSDSKDGNLLEAARYAATAVEVLAGALAPVVSGELGLSTIDFRFRLER